MILNLDKSFNPLINKEEIKFELFTFSGGEPHIKIKSNLERINKVTITQRIKSFNDLGVLLITVDALRKMGVKKINLLLPYFPAARQDRLMTKGEALSIKVYTDIINFQNFESVTIFDPHSEVTPALLNNCKVVENYKFIETVTKELPKELLLISPDGGALKKIHKVAAYLRDFNVIECSKSRDVKTGEISGFKVYADDLKGRPCLIVDDICDGGGTFLGLAKELKNKNAGTLYLAISHGIFSKGFEDLTKYFKIIFTTDSFKNTEQKNVQQIKLSDGLLS